MIARTRQAAMYTTINDVGQLDGEDGALPDAVVEQDRRQLLGLRSEVVPTRALRGEVDQVSLVRGVNGRELGTEVGYPVGEELLHGVGGPAALRDVVGDPLRRMHLPAGHCVSPGLLVRLDDRVHP
jgi:hypothetical protein